MAHVEANMEISIIGSIMGSTKFYKFYEDLCHTSSMKKKKKNEREIY